MLTDGSIWTWGENVYGQLVNNTQTWSNVPVQEATHGTWAQVAGGHVHTLALGIDGYVYAGGAAPSPANPTNPWNRGQLGYATQMGSLVLQRTLAVTLGGRQAQPPHDPLVLYPNPASQWLLVEGLPEKATLTLRTTHGQRVLVQQASRKAHLRLNHVGAGSYLLTVEAEDRAPQTQRVVIE